MDKSDTGEDTSPYDRLITYIKEIEEYPGLSRRFSQRLMAEECGINEAALSRALREKRGLDRHWLAIAKSLGLSLNWLLRGLGPQEIGAAAPEIMGRPQVREPPMPYLPEGLPWDQAVREINWSLIFENARLRAEIAALRGATAPSAAAAPPSPRSDPPPDPQSVADERSRREQAAADRLAREESDRNQRHG